MGQWITPPTLPGGFYCRVLRIPDDPYLIGAVMGALWPLAYASSWEAPEGNCGAADTAEAMLNMIWAAYLDTGDCNADMDVRQENETPCILSKSADGVEWTPFADLRLCTPITPITRYDDETGELQASYDGGETWVDDRAHDPRFTGTLFPDESLAACLAAKQVITVIRRYYDDLLGGMGDGLTGIALGSVATAVTGLVFGFSFFPALALLLVDAAIAAGSAAIQAAFTDDVWQRLLCSVLARLDSGNRLLPEDYDIILADVEANESGVAEVLLKHFLWQLGSTGLTNGTALGLDNSWADDLDCDQCGTFSHDIDTTSDDGGFEVPSGHGGVWTASVGWETTWGLQYGGDWYSEVHLEQTIADRTLTKVRVEFSGDNGSLFHPSAVNNQINLYAGETQIVNAVWACTYGQNLYREWTGSAADITKVVIRWQDGAWHTNPGTGGTVHITRILVEGMGADPFT